MLVFMNIFLIPEVLYDNYIYLFTSSMHMSRYITRQCACACVRVHVCVCMCACAVCGLAPSSRATRDVWVINKKVLCAMRQ